MQEEGGLQGTWLSVTKAETFKIMIMFIACYTSNDLIVDEILTFFNFGIFQHLKIN